MFFIFANGLLMEESVGQEKKQSRRWPWVVLCCLIGLFLTIYLAGAAFFYYHYGFNTIIDGADVSFKPPEATRQIIENQVSQYSLKIEARESAPVIITGEQIELNYMPDSQSTDILASQNIFAWPARLFTPQEAYRTNASVSFNFDKLKSISSNWTFMDTSLMKPPKDAYLEFQSPSYVVVGEYRGTTLDPKKAQEAIAAAVNGLQADLNLVDNACYTMPTVLSDDPELLSQIGLYNRYVPFSISYVFGDSVEVLDGRTAINWVDTSAEPTGELNLDAVAAWVADYAARHDTVGKARKIVNGFGETKEVNGDVAWVDWQGGPYGWAIDQNAEIEAILTAAHEHLGEVREPYFLQRAASFGPQDWGTTYLEVDITAQHMWFYKDGKLIVESDVVTGQPINDRDTPTGVFFVIEKSAPKRMKSAGWPGVEPYDETVNYFVGFTPAGHGFHDGLWRNAFGGSIWVNNGSHGCINMPLAPAQTLFNAIDYDTPVVAHM